MRPNKQYFIVEINLQEQEDRKILIPGTEIKIADTAQDFKYYLQMAPIIAIGEMAAKYMPEAEIGDYLIFHHVVEFDEWRLINRRVTSNLPYNIAEKKDVYLQILVKADIDDVFGIQKANTLEIIPSHEHVWCEELKEQSSFEVEVIAEDGTKKTILALATDNEESLRLRLEELQKQAEFLATGSMQNKEQMMKLKTEQESITRELNKPRAQPLKISHINKATADRLDAKVGDTVISNGWIGYKGYPLSVQNLYLDNGVIKKRGTKEDYILVRAKFLLGIKK